MQKHRPGSRVSSITVADTRHDHEGSELGEMDVRVRALESILVDKGYVQPAALDEIVEAYETRIGPHLGAQAVARAWTDPEFDARLAADATSALDEMGIGVHNLVVCTLCSCYPWAVLGIPPAWYKSSAYRSRAVLEPRAVLAEFGTELPADTTIRVWDSTAEVRYLVVPRRPAGTDGWDAERLATLVSRDSMVGVRDADAPS